MNATQICLALQNAGHEAFIIGGAVRDQFLGLEVKDEDVVTSARPDQIVALFRNRKVSEVGKSFGVVLVDGIEVATYRKDRYAGFDDKAVEITFADTLLEDVSRRDFTINTIAMNPATGEIIDHFNGHADLEARVIRFVGNPEERIKEDPNRILRACRFAAKIGGTLDHETAMALKACAHFVKKYVAPERISKEILAAMKVKNASTFFYLLHQIGCLKDILPSLEGCFNHEHGNHHAEDVFAHQMMAGDHVSTRFPLVKLATYLHDVGKPASYDPEARTFYEHQKLGADLLASELPKLRFSNEDTTRICNLVRHHMLIHFEHPTPKSVRRVLRKLHDDSVDFRDLLRIWDADLMGSLNHALEHAPNRFSNLLAAYRVISPELHRPEPVRSLSNLKIDGKDVCRIAGIRPSKKVGEILNHLLEVVLDNPEMNNEETLSSVVRKLA